MVDIQRRAVVRSLAKGASASTSGVRSPHMYQSKTDALALAMADAESDANFFSALGNPSPATSTGSSASSSSSATVDSIHSPYEFHQNGLLPMQHEDDDDNLFAAYAAEPQQQELEDALRNNAWDLYYGAPPTPLSATSVSAPLVPSSTSSTSSTSSMGPSPSLTVATAASLPTLSISASAIAGRGAVRATAAAAPSRTTGARQGVKRPLDRSVGAPVPLPSPTAAVASSMLAMRNNNTTTSEPTKLTAATTSAVVATAASGRATAATGRRSKKEEAAAAAAAAAAFQDSGDDSSAGEQPPLKKIKVSRERQLKINAASRRCRKKQKLELQFLRTHVVDLQSALKDQVGVLKSTNGQQQRCARLATLLEESIRQVEDMSSGGRPGGTPKASLYSESELQSLKNTASQAMAEVEQMQQQQQQLQQPKMEEQQVQTPTNQMRPPPLQQRDGCSVRALDPMTGYSLSEDRKKTLLNIASFMRNNISLESQSFSPEVISCLPIEMDGWQLRLAITEKNYTIHNCKFFPCDVLDLYDFCWDTNVESKIRIKQGKNDYCVVTPLDDDVAHVYSKTIGKWSLSVHGVANVSYNSLVCRTYNADMQRAMICQQSVLEDRDFQDESTIPWLFKRWVVFQRGVVDGVEGTFVEAYRTASYATGRLIYKEDNTYDSFCEHLIRRYAESNSMLERMMARDPRFRHVAAIDSLVPSDKASDHEQETTSDRMVKDLLLF